MLIAEEMEQKFSKQQIFEFLRQLGQSGTAARIRLPSADSPRLRALYFNKRLERHYAAGKRLCWPESSKGPAAYTPYRHPERALERRNLVLDSMVDTHAITPMSKRKKAKASPLKVGAAECGGQRRTFDFVVHGAGVTLINKISANTILNDAIQSSGRIYTTLDPDLQKAAAQAVRKTGIKLGGVKIRAGQEAAHQARFKVGKIGEDRMCRLGHGSTGAGCHGGA